MALNIYTGLMGSGKTYEVVAYVIVPAIASGIDVVTNVAGLEGQDAIDRVHNYIIANRSKFPNVMPDDKLGTIRHFTGSPPPNGEGPELLPQPFWPVEGDVSSDTFMRPGDLAVFDEIWRFWPEGSRINKVDLAAFRMHRHFTHPDTKVTSNIILVTQSITDVSRMVRSVIEMAFRCKKLKSLGMTSTYNVRFWERTIGSEKNSIGFQVRRYNKDIFALYKSYSQGTGPGTEVMADKRQNILLSKKFIFGIPVAIGVAVIAFYFAYGFFHPNIAKASAVPGGSVSSAALGGRSDPLGRLPDHPQNAATKAAQTVAANPWRIAGFLIRGPSRYVLLEDETGRVRVEAGSAAQWDHDEPVSISLDGVLATRYTGRLPGAAAPAPVPSGASVPAPGRRDDRASGNELLGVLNGSRRPSAETARAVAPNPF